MTNSADLATVVSAFNALPRHPEMPSGMAQNHWHISIRRVDIEPPGDVLFFCQPFSHYVHVEGKLM